MNMRGIGRPMNRARRSPLSDSSTIDLNTGHTTFGSTVVRTREQYGAGVLVGLKGSGREVGQEGRWVICARTWTTSLRRGLLPMGADHQCAIHPD